MRILTQLSIYHIQAGIFKEFNFRYYMCIPVPKPELCCRNFIYPTISHLENKRVFR